MDRAINLQNSLPDDIALTIASCLQVCDLCSLGSCSRFWREMCGSDCVWQALCKNRWPEISLNQESDSNSEGWRGLYISKHNEIVGKAAKVENFVENFVERASGYESIEVGNYLMAVELLNSFHFGFKDVEMFLLKPKLNVLLNLVGLHYCILCLGIPAKNVIEALGTSQVSERQVCVQWWKLGRWFYGFRLRDECRSRVITLGNLATYDEEVLGVLHRGAIHEVIRVQISVSKPTHKSWSYQNFSLV